MSCMEMQVLSVKSDQGQASYYYSQPWIRLTASLRRQSGEELALSGVAWLDREWSSQPLAPNQEGWDWFSLHLPGNRKLMAYRLRHSDGRHYLSGTLVRSDGEVRRLQEGELLLEPLRFRSVQGRELPLEWRLQLPSEQLELLVSSVYDDQWMDTSFPYWEGMVEVTLVAGSKSHQTGVGYMELTGYRQDSID